RAITAAKDRWFFGLHHNSAHANYQFLPDPIFDFHLAGPDDLRSPTGTPFRQIEMDCSNFCASFWEQKSLSPPHWDALLVARAAHFKSLEDLFEIVRKLFNKEGLVRVLAIVGHED